MDRMRWRYGDTNPVIAAVEAKTIVEIGDLVFMDANDTAKPAHMLVLGELDNGIKNTLQRSFTFRFLGVAMQRSRAGETDSIRVATTGVFEFDCAPSTFELGNLIGVALMPKGEKLFSQQVVKVDCEVHAIARVAKRESASQTSVLVDIRSTIMTGGVQAPAAHRQAETLATS